jgi:FkbH-like protein
MNTHPQHEAPAQKLARSLERDRDLPAAHKALKALRYGTSLALAPLYLLACDHVGPGARTRGRPLISNAGRITLGARVGLASTFVPVRLRTGEKGALTIGDDVLINFGCSLSADDRVTLGDRVSLGPYVEIADAGEQGEPRPIVIGDDVWLATRVRVHGGAMIGEGSVITAGSEVSGEIPPFVVAGGIPARVLRQRKAGESAPEVSAVEAPVSAPPAAPPKVEAAKPMSGSPSKATNGAAAKGVEAAAPELRGLLLSDFSIRELATHLQAHDALGPRIEAVAAPFDQVVQTLAQLDALAAAEHADFALVWTRPEAIPSFREQLLGKTVPLADVLAEVDDFAARIRAAASSVKQLFVASWVLPAFERGLGMIDLREGGLALTLLRMNLRLVEALAGAPKVFVLDAGRWVAAAAHSATSSKLWFLGKVSFSADVFAEAAKDLRAALRGLRGAAKKLVVLDLDDTLWGGIVGDLGWEHLVLGGHDALGESYVDFQRHLLALSRRGVLLAVVSKNEESVALEAIARHPAMVIKADDLAAYKINWRDKAANIAELVSELNLGLQSVVFLDDNPVERARVREALPEVFVPEWPDDKLLYTQALSDLRCFDVPSVSREDLERTRMYAAERGREALKKSVGSLDDWLLSLGTKVSFARLDASNITRTVQLLNKTNQMNLSTRRLGEAELGAWAAAPGHELWAVSVADKLGDAGLTGILGLALEGDALRVVDYVLSCRVMGRRVEETMLCAAVSRARSLGARVVLAAYLPTPKNKPCLGLFQGSGFTLDEASKVFSWPTERAYPVAASIEALGLDLRGDQEVRHA